MEKLSSQDNLVISRRSVSIVSAMLIVLGTSAFIAGYFWGYRRGSVEIQTQIRSTSFVDQVNQSVSKEFGNKSMPADDIKPIAVLDKKNESSILEQKTVDGVVHEYHAELVGFGRLKSAQNFIDKAKKKGYPVHLRKRVGKTGNGKVIHWYQAITEKFKDKAKLDQLIGSMTRTERLKGVKIKKS